LIHDGELGDLTGISAVWVEGLAEGGAHLLDYVRVLTGGRPSWAQASLDADEGVVDPGGSFILGYHQPSLRVVVHMDRASVAPPQVEVYGTEGMLRLGNFLVQRWRFERVAARIVPVELPFPGRHDGRSGMTIALDQLIDAMEHGTRPASTLQDGRIVLETTLGILASGRTGCRIDAPFRDVHEEAHP
jgi:predicted dehydrogenase